MKRKIVISCLLLVSVGMVTVYHNKLWGQAEHAEGSTEEVSHETTAHEPTEPEMVEPVVEEKPIPTRLTDIPFSDVASVLDDDTLAAIIDWIGDKAGSPIKLSRPAKDIARLFDALEQFEKDIRIAQAQKNKLKIMAVCSQLPRKSREGQQQCIQVGCGESRTECLRKAIAALKIILKPFINDTFLGYDKDGKHIEGIAMIVLDVVQQGGVKNELSDVTDPLKKVMRVLDVLEKNIQPRSKK